MGFLDRLRSSASTLTMTLGAEEVAPGGELAVHYEVTGEVDESCRAVRIEVKARARYYIIEPVKGEFGGWVDKQRLHLIDLHEEVRELSVAVGPHVARFTVPDGASPSSGDMVEWTVTARIDRKGRDSKEIRKVAVRAPLGQAVAPALAVSRSGITLSDVPAAVRGGQALTGHLSVDVAEDVGVSRVSIRLLRGCVYKKVEREEVERAYPSERWPTGPTSTGFSRVVKEQEVAMADLLGRYDFRSGEPYGTPFSILVPDGLATTAHRHASVEWRVEAVLHRPWKDISWKENSKDLLSVSVPIVVV